MQSPSGHVQKKNEKRNESLFDLEVLEKIKAAKAPDAPIPIDLRVVRENMKKLRLKINLLFDTQRSINDEVQTLKQVSLYYISQKLGYKHWFLNIIHDYIIVRPSC